MVGEAETNMNLTERRAIFCQKCGNQQPYGANFCQTCGARLFKPAEKLVVPPSPTANHAPVHLESMRMSNPNDYGNFLFSMCFLIPGCIIGCLWVGFDDGFTFYTIMYMLVFTIATISLTFLYFEVLSHPREIEFSDAGVTLYQKIGGPLLVPWTRLAFSFGYRDPKDKKWHSNHGILMVSEKKSYDLHWKVGEMLIERYQAYMGHYPPKKFGPP